METDSATPRPGSAPASPRFDILAPEEGDARGGRRDMGSPRPSRSAPPTRGAPPNHAQPAALLRPPPDVTW